MASFVKIKDIRNFDIPWNSSQGKNAVRMTATIVLRHRAFWPWNPPYEVEHQVWSNFNDGFRFLKWRSNGTWLPDAIQYAVEMAAAFGEAEYAS